jgi:tripartite-type tricarboxylate transporter receptor subunit TctC
MRISSLALLAALAIPASASAQDAYPSKPIRMIVNFPAGGSVDVIGRSIAQKLTESLGQPVVVENRAGASGNIGAEFVAKSAGDGYTILMTNGATLTTNPHLYKTSFDTLRDFTPITQAARISLMLTVKPALPVRTAGEFLTYARANPGKLTYGSAGNGSGPHIASELLNRLAGVSTVHVPYKGLGPALNDLLAGQIDFMFIDGGGYPQVRAGKIRLLAVASGSRLSLLPDVPTLIESGVAGFNYDSAHALAVPAGTPREIVARLNTEIVKILRTPDVNERIRTAVAEVIGNTPDEAAANMREDLQRIGRIIHEMGIRAD